MPDDLSDMVKEFREELKMAYQPKGTTPDLNRIIPPGYKPDELAFQLRTGCVHELQYVKASDGTRMKVCIECDIAEEIGEAASFKLEGPI